MLKIKLSRNLRRSIMRGHPWVFKEAVTLPGSIQKAQLCRVQDTKGDLAWAIFDPHSPIALRILSTESLPPTEAFLQKRFEKASARRASLLSQQTDSYRLFNGEGDLLPGLVCDIYNSVAVLQFDGQGPSEFWDKTRIAKWLLEFTSCKTVIEKTRSKSGKTTNFLDGLPCDDVITITENGAKFKVNLDLGQKTGFFLDQRENRHYVQQISKNKIVLNLFSYTGGFSIYAGLGGAKKVASVDISKGAIALAEENWALNGLSPSNHSGLCVDVFDYLSNDRESWDHIIVDPPSMSHSENQKELAITKYIELFASAAKRVKAGGELSLSSCSSHISFEDFFEIIDAALSGARRTGQILRVSGQGFDHPFPSASHELRYLKFVHIVL